MSRARSRFHPRLVPEIRNGYYWLAKDAVGLGTTSFKVLEGNKHPAFDLAQATVASQPTALSENGGVQFRMRRAADANPSILNSAGNVKAGWTGPTYVAGWWRLPDNSGDVTGTNRLFQHTFQTAGIRRLNLSTNNGSPDIINAVTSDDGTATITNTWAQPFSGGTFKWFEYLVLPGTSVELNVGFSLVAHITTASPGATLADVATQIAIGSLIALANADTTDWATCYYANGIPSLKNRKRLANYLAPVNTKFAI